MTDTEKIEEFENRVRALHSNLFGSFIDYKGHLVYACTLLENAADELNKAVVESRKNEGVRESE